MNLRGDLIRNSVKYFNNTTNTYTCRTFTFTSRSLTTTMIHKFPDFIQIKCFKFGHKPV